MTQVSTSFNFCLMSSGICGWAIRAIFASSSVTFALRAVSSTLTSSSDVSITSLYFFFVARYRTPAPSNVTGITHMGNPA